MSRTRRAARREVFISVGHHLMPDEAVFVQLIKEYLVGQGLMPLTIERQTQMISDPIDTIRAMIKKTVGTIVVAVERVRITEGLEYPRSRNMRQLTEMRLTTVWNQIEAAMTLQIGHPLLIFAEDGVSYEGIIDPSIYPVHHFCVPSAGNSLSADVESTLSGWCKVL